jgi:hypothetical protein
VLKENTLPPGHLALLYLFACVGLLLSGCNSNPTASIEQVLRRDKQAGDEFKQATSNLPKGNRQIPALTAAIAEQCAKQRSISLSGCPSEFKTAYLRHIRAWEDHAVVIRDMPPIPSFLEGLLIGFARGIQGDFTGGSGEMDAEIRAWKAEFKHSETELTQSWRNVEDIATRHGANLP